MSFSRVKPSGWTDDVDTVTATQLNTLDADHSNSFDLVGGATVTGSTTYSGSSAKVYKRYTTGTDAAQEIDESQDLWKVPTLTANRVWTLDTTTAPAAAGVLVRVTKTGSANQLTIQTETGPTTLATMLAANTCWAEFVWNGTGWEVSAWGGGTTVP